MKFPTPQAYGEALQAPKLSVLDSTLKGGTVQTDALGLPFGRTGSFAITFKVAAKGKDFAYRCFLQDRATMQERYDGISSFLGSVHLPFFVEFAYMNAGVQVDGKQFPTVRMEWADGVPLGLYMQDHYADSGRMTALQQQIQGMALVLHSAGIAHGDIQGGNVLVGSGGEIRLVDYDGMFVPTINDLGAIEIGHPNFQHPQRSAEKPFDVNVDNFSFAVLHTVLSGLIEDPTLWNSLDGDADRFLIGESDFADPFGSPTFAVLAALPSTGRYARSLQAISASPYANIPSFTDFLNSRNIPTVTSPPREQARATRNVSRGEQPWYHQDAVIASSGSPSPEQGVGLLVCDASDPDDWLNRNGTEVELIGIVQSVDLATVDGSPFATIHLEHPWEEGEPYICVLIDQGARTDLAMSGKPLGSLWEGSWISASGSLTAHEGEEDEETGDSDNYFAIYIEDSSALTLLNEHEALRRIGAVETGEDEQESQVVEHEAAVEQSPIAHQTNTDAIAQLDGSGSKPTQSTPTAAANKPAAQQSIPSAAPAPVQKESMSVPAAVGLVGGILVGIGVLAVILVAIFSAVADDNSSGDQVLYEVGDCFAGAIRTPIDCDSTNATRRVVEVLTDGSGCEVGQTMFAGDPLVKYCVERISDEAATEGGSEFLWTGDCVDAEAKEVDCANPKAVSEIAWSVTGEMVRCPTGSERVEVAAQLPQGFTAVCLKPIVDYQTCIELGEANGDAFIFGSITNNSGQLARGDCFEKLGWDFEDWQCYSEETAKTAVLQQFKKKSGRWETVKTDIADNLSCSNSFDGYLDIAFSRKASTPGVKDYRVLFADGSWYEIIVTVTEEPRS